MNIFIEQIDREDAHKLNALVSRGWDELSTAQKQEFAEAASAWNQAYEAFCASTEA